MKDVGFTQEGGRLIEMGQQEYLEFQKLRSAIEGLSFPSIIHFRENSFRESFDFTKTFEVIGAWYMQKFMVNQLQKHLDLIKRSMSGE